MGAEVLDRLAAMIRARRTATADKSYTRSLLDGGPARCAKKLGEEAVEAVIAGTSEGAAELTAEAADVIFHLMVLLEARGVAFDDVMATLERRMRQSGLEEKAARAGQ